jgi:hypothetical protein
MGGEYIEGNVIEVEVTQCDRQTANHIMWHFANWQLWGKEEDKLAWKGLAGYIGKEEIIHERSRLGGRIAGTAKWWTNGEEEVKSHACPAGWCSGRSNIIKSNLSIKRAGKRDSDETKEKKSLTAKGRAKSQSHKENISKTHNTPEMIALHSKQAEKINRQKWMCLKTGKVSSPGPLTRYQRSRGIDTSLRVRVG